MKTWKRYLISCLLFIAFGIGIYFIIYNNQKEYISASSVPSFVYYIYWGFEATSIAGAFALACGALYYTSLEGAFDGFAYATKSAFTAIFRGKKYPYSFSEYKTIKHEGEHGHVGHLFIPGIILLAIGIIGGLAIYYNYFN